MNNLLKILNLSKEQAQEAKFKFNLNVNGDQNKPADQLLKNHFDDFINMTAFRLDKSSTSKLDNEKYVVSFAKDNYYPDRYLFGGLFYVEPLENFKTINNKVGYRLYLDTVTQKYIKNLWVVVNQNVGMSISRKYDSASKLISEVITHEK